MARAATARSRSREPGRVGPLPLPTGTAKRDNRRAVLLDAAARHFRLHGYAGTAMRDIAAEAGMLAGSIYYYFPSKEELLVAVHEEGIRRIMATVDSAVAAEAEPWARLEAAAAAHLEALVEGGDYAQVVIRDIPRGSATLRERLIALRDAYEARFVALIVALPLATAADRRALRLMLLGALNWAPTWYRSGGARPAEIARRFVATLRCGAEGGP